MSDKRTPAMSDRIDPHGGDRTLRAVEDDTEGNRFRGASAPRAAEPIEPAAGRKLPRIDDNDGSDTEGHERR